MFRAPNYAGGALFLGLTAAMPVWGANLHISDDTGQAVVLPKPALRIIALYSAYNEILAEMGLLDRLVGRTKADTEPPEIMAKPSIGTHMRPNVEMILGLQPDLIIQDAGAQEAMPGLEQLKQQGVAVAVFHPTSFDKSLWGYPAVGGVDRRAGAGGRFNREAAGSTGGGGGQIRGGTGPRFSLRSVILIFWGQARDPWLMIS